MELKFFLNKFAKIDNIEGYTYSTVLLMKETYSNYLYMSEGKDPDFPLMDFGGKGKTINVGKNVYSQFDEGDVPEDFIGIDIRAKHKEHDN